MKDYSSSIVPVQNENKFSLIQYHQSDLEQKQMETIPYALVEGSLIYAQTYTRLRIIFVVGMLDRHQNNPRLDH